MILYHGSNVEVKNPKVIKTDKGRDFGPAFYVTPIKDQAERMAKRKQLQMKLVGKEATAIVSVYEWDENIEGKSYKDFRDADMDWLEMIIKCRTNSSFRHNYDIVEGKIADDSVGETVSICVNGFISKEQAIEKLKFQKINSQIAFCNDEVCKDLKFVKSYEVK